MSRIKVDRITDKAGTGAPILVNGMNVTGKSTMGDIVGAAATFNSITGGSANFSSDVSIGGTLTYEDVKNVDSVGLITARNGVKTNVSPSITIRDDSTEKGYIGFNGNDPFMGRKNGVGLVFQNNKIRPADGDDGTPSTNTVDLGEPTYKFKDGYFAGSLYGDGSQLSGIEAAPTVQAVASGAIAANKPVRLNEDGTISEIKNTALSAATGSNTDIPHQYDPIVKAAVWISSTKFVLFWIADNDSDKLIAAVGTASGTTITYGSRTVIDGSNSAYRVSAVYDSSLDVVLVAYNSQGGAGYIKGLTVSGTTITVNGTGHNTGDATSTCDIASDNKGGFVFAWVNTSQQWQVKAGTVTAAGAISVGTQINIANSRTISNDYNTMRICYDKDSDAWVSICRFNNNTDYSILTRSGTIVTETSASTPPTIISSTQDSNVNIVYYETEKRFLITSKGTSGVKYATPRMNSTTTALDTGGNGTWTEGAQDNAGYLAYDIGTNKAFYIFANGSFGNTKLLTITLNSSGTTGSGGDMTSQQLESYADQGLAVACNGEGLVLTCVDKQDNSDVNTRLKQLAVTVSNLRADSFIGFSGDAISNSASGTIKVVGNIATQSGLTPSKKYYVQKDGTVGKAADDPSVVAGVALSSTTILIKG